MNKKTIKLVTLIAIMILVVITLTGCTAKPGKLTKDEKTSTKDELSSLTSYVQDEDMEGYSKCEQMAGIEFYYPSNYSSVGKSTQPMYMDPDILGASVNLVSETVPSTFTFEGYVDASIIGIKKQMTINGDIDKEYINLNGNKACKLEYVATSSGKTMKITQVVLVKNSKAYILTVGSLKEDAEALQPKLEKMIKSFK